MASGEVVEQLEAHIDIQNVSSIGDGDPWAQASENSLILSLVISLALLPGRIALILGNLGQVIEGDPNEIVERARMARYSVSV